MENFELFLVERRKLLSDNLKANSIFGQRPEQLSVSQFIELTTLIQNDK